MSTSATQNETTPETEQFGAHSQNEEQEAQHENDVDSEKPHDKAAAQSETEKKTVSVKKPPSDSEPSAITLNAKFSSFLQLRGAIEKYQRDNSVQLIVKDSKLLKAESTRRVIPKVYHLVNQDLMYHSITYTCKCHGELKQKPGTRMKNVGQKRLNCPMYIRLKLTPDLQKLVLFDLHEEHNHGIDPTFFQMTPRQQVYHLKRMKRRHSDTEEAGVEGSDVTDSLTRTSVDADSSSDVDNRLPRKTPKTEVNSNTAKIRPPEAGDEEKSKETVDEGIPQNRITGPDSPLDSSSSCSDSDEEELRCNRRLLPFPIRLIGSAINSNPELIASTKELIELQKSKLSLEREKLLMETKLLELTNTKLELEVRQLQRSLALETSQPQDRTIYLQAQ